MNLEDVRNARMYTDIEFTNEELNFTPACFWKQIMRYF